MSFRPDLGQGKGELKDLYFPLWHYAIVVNTEDDFDAGRIQVRMEGVDRRLSLPGGGKDEPGDKDINLVWCEPLMPKYLNIVPKEGEMVRVAVFNYHNKYQRRVYMGPVIGQQTLIDFNKPDYQRTKDKVENSAYTAKWSLFPETRVDNKNWKVWPNKDDIAIIGRINTDLILRDRPNYNEIILRVGKIDSSTINAPSVPGLGVAIPAVNEKNPAYITINHTLPKNNTTAKDVSLGLDNSRTHVNIVADKLNFISHMGSSKKGNAPTIITGENIREQIEIENVRLHPLIYGDLVWEFMNLMKNYVIGHIHKGSRREPDGDKTKNDLIEWFNKNMGSQKPKISPEGLSYVDFENCTFLSKGVKTN